MSVTPTERFRGCLLGLAAGDAVGTTVEFKPRGFAPVTDMVGGGPFGLQPGQWTDDTSMALCLATSLVEQADFDADDQMQRYCRWWEQGYPDRAKLLHFCGESSRTTHGAAECLDASRLFGDMLRLAMAGAEKSEILRGDLKIVESAAIQAIASGAYQQKSRDEIRGTGYVVESLEAALWCFWTTNSFEAAILMATNLGDDADTTAAIAGQIAGAYYGESGIPAAWLARLTMRVEITQLADQLRRDLT